MKWVRDWVAKGQGVAGRRWRWLRGWRPDVRGWPWRARWLAHRAGERGVGVILLVIGLGGAGAVIGVLIEDPQWLTGDGEGRESRSTTIRNMGLIGGGALAILIAYWRSRLAQQDLLNKRYQEGAAMLGNDVLSVRLAGIYALQRLAEDHPWEYHIEVMKSLCAFVRNPTEDEHFGRILDLKEEPIVPLVGWQSGPELREDVQAALDAIGVCHEHQLSLEAAHDFRLDLRGAQLRRVRLFKHLSRARLARANLAESFLVGVDMRRASISRANLSGASLVAANMSGADLANANLSGTMLASADLTRAIVQGANLSGSDLRRAQMTRAMVYRAKLMHADLSGAVLRRAMMQSVNLTGAKLLGIDATGASLMFANLTSADFGVFTIQDNSGARETRETVGLTQRELDRAVADPDNPPKLEGVLDAETGEELVWRGRELDADPSFGQPLQ